MITRLETWKRAAPALKKSALALALVAGLSGSAMASGDEASFTARAQSSQGGAASTDDHAGATTPSIDSEATSFISRVEMSQGVATRGAAEHGPMSTDGQAGAMVRSGDVESFILRVEASQGIASQHSS